MNTPNFCRVVLATLALLKLTPATAATLAYRDWLDYGPPFAGANYYNMGITYIELAFDQPGHFDYSVNYLGGDYFRTMMFTGTQGLLTGVVSDIRWFHDLGEVRFMGTSSGDLPAGHYLFTIWGQNSQWNWQDNGYQPNGRLELPLDVSRVPYFQLTLNGDFRPVSIWEGSRTGTSASPTCRSREALLLLASRCLLSAVAGNEKPWKPGSLDHWEGLCGKWSCHQ